MNKNLLVIIALLLFQNFAFSQVEKGIESQAEIKEKCQQIVDDFTKDDISSVFEQLRKIWILPVDELNNLESQTIKQLNVVEDRFGDFIENKLVNEDLVVDVLYRLDYVVKLDYHALRVRFVFYNGKDKKWYLNNFKWDDSLSEIFSD